MPPTNASASGLKPRSSFTLINWVYSMGVGGFQIDCWIVFILFIPTVCAYLHWQQCLQRQLCCDKVDLKQSEDSWLLALTVKTRQDLAFILRQKENTKECQWCSGNMYPFQGWARGPIPLWRKLFATIYFFCHSYYSTIVRGRYPLYTLELDLHHDYSCIMHPFVATNSIT